MLWSHVLFVTWSTLLTSENFILISQVKTNYIKEQHREIVLHQINDIIRQLNDNVTKTPVVAFPPDIQQPLNLPPSSAIKTDTLQVSHDIK